MLVHIITWRFRLKTVWATAGFMFQTLTWRWHLSLLFLTPCAFALLSGSFLWIMTRKPSSATAPPQTQLFNYRENKDLCFLFVQQRTLIHWFWLKYLTLNQTLSSGGWTISSEPQDLGWAPPGLLWTDVIAKNGSQNVFSQENILRTQNSICPLRN